MMNFFPQIYEDELFYSIISRYKQLNGINSKQALLIDLYNKKISLNSIFFPPYIGSLVSNLPATSKIKSEEIVLNNTMYPLFTAFLSEEKANLILDGMVNGTNSNCYSKVGLIASTIKMNKYMKYCPVCLESEIKTLGESYWKRIHQIPGVIYCDKHKVELEDSSTLLVNSRVEYSCADYDTCNKDVRCTNELKHWNKNKSYIKNIKYLLSNDVKRKTLDFINDFYIDKLRERNLASKSGNIYMIDLQSEFINFYGHEYLKLLQSDIDIESPTNWLRLFIRKSNKNKNVLRHLLMLQFLGVEAVEFFECEKVIGKMDAKVYVTPKLDKDIMREKWLDIIKNNPTKTSVELKEIGKGIHTWIYKHDTNWYHEVTPRSKRNPLRAETIDWKKRDDEFLLLAKNAVKELLNQEGKPIRITRQAIRRKLGATIGFNNKKLVKTHQYINKASEDIDSYRVRKIKWAIDEMMLKDINITAYKVQLYAGFGGNNKTIRNMIEDLL